MVTEITNPNDEDESRQFERFVSKILRKFDGERIKKLITNAKSYEKEFSDEICNVLSCLYILKKIQDYASGQHQEAYKDKDNINQEAKDKYDQAVAFKRDLIRVAQPEYPFIESFLNEFEMLILSIEVHSHNGEKENFQFIYFPNHPVFEYLAADSKDSIMMRVERETQRDKLISLL